MGIYLNPGNEKFGEAIRSEIYVDKTGVIKYTNDIIGTSQKYICVSRPRRFGKSMTANMLEAYYCRENDSDNLFCNYAIAKEDSYKKYLNKFDTIFLNMQEFLSQTSSMDEMLTLIKKSILWDLLDKYRDFRYFDENNLTRTMQDVYVNTKTQYVVIIDEWDCIFREYKNDKDSQEKYLDFLRDLLKDKSYISLTYMTGILPIKKYGTHSALNMFDEFSMINPGPLAPYVGFTESEVEVLCDKYGMDINEIKNWYNGYSFPDVGAVYSPRSVVNSMRFKQIANYWNQTETFEALQVYIDMNYDGLRDDIVNMMMGESVPVNTGSFVNDMTTFKSKDDVLTLLIHLGYLSFDYYTKTVSIPNSEVLEEYVTAVSVSDWGEVSKALKNSAYTLRAIWEGREEQVAKGIQEAHYENSHIQYNDENALSYTLSLALYTARNFYTVYREFAGGKGFADLVLIPRKRFPDKPALVVELKWDETAETAISQIKNKKYCKSLEEYQGNILLVGITYDKKTKEHQCIIEQFQK